MRYDRIDLGIAGTITGVQIEQVSEDGDKRQFEATFKCYGMSPQTEYAIVRALKRYIYADYIDPLELEGNFWDPQIKLVSRGPPDVFSFSVEFEIFQHSHEDYPEMEGAPARVSTYWERWGREQRSRDFIRFSFWVAGWLLAYCVAMAIAHLLAAHLGYPQVDNIIAPLLLLAPFVAGYLFHRKGYRLMMILLTALGVFLVWLAVTFS